MSKDALLQQAVIEELEWEPSVTAAHVGVTARDGVVTLTGHLPTFWEKDAVEQAAARVKGVRAVVDETSVELLGNPVSDERLAEDALSHIAKDSSIAGNQVQVHVAKGHITLTGKVEWQFQKAAALAAVHKLPGVTWVTNAIKIQPHVDAAAVREKIEKALERVAPFDAECIAIRETNGVITLSGQLDTLYERDLVETAAWSVPGVLDVDDQITITR